MSILKMIHSWTPTNVRLHQKNKEIPVQCPLCQKEEETIHHQTNFVLPINGENRKKT
jgi:hypothetical protein